MADLFSDLNLPQSSYLPPEYSRQALEQVNIGRARAEEESMRRFLEGINAMGRLYSGSALRSGIQEILGPSIERQQQLLGGLALQGMEAQRGERLTGEAREYESGQAALQRDWQAQQNELQRALQERMFATQMAEQRRAQRSGRRLSTQLSGAVAPMLAMGGAYALGGLPALAFGAGGAGGGMGSGGGMPALNMFSAPAMNLSRNYSTNMFGRNLGFGEDEYGR